MWESSSISKREHERQSDFVFCVDLCVSVRLVIKEDIHHSWVFIREAWLSWAESRLQPPTGMSSCSYKNIRTSQIWKKNSNVKNVYQARNSRTVSSPEGSDWHFVKYALISLSDRMQASHSFSPKGLTGARVMSLEYFFRKQGKGQHLGIKVKV